MMRLLSNLKFRDESGGVVVLVALFMVILLGLAGVAIDGGRLYFEKSKLQKALDAAVLAGAHKLVLIDQNESKKQAKIVAKDISQENGYELSDADIKDKDVVHKSHIRVEKTVTVPLTFAKVIGINTASVSASAKAKIAGPLISARGIAPIAIEKSAVPTKAILTCGEEENEEEEKKSGKKSPGNCGFIRIDGNGAPIVEEGIKNGSKKKVSVGDEVHPEPGVMNGPIDKAVETAVDSIINSDKDKPHCQSPSTADNSCKRVIYVALIETWAGVNGASDKVKILGFAPFWVKEYDNKGKNKNIVGQFIDGITAGEVGEPSAGFNYGLYGVKLVE
ncbi:Tad domain-containing protein [Bacillus sp. JJ1503]|uniref:Tad domain-containing protein n=1 Tax=Bacillus sp. JJ1503 TaxID=3122956 RepID=UPI0030002856